MSFINNKKDNIISVKMTEAGRRNIATGTLNYAKWAIGDSEINYEREYYNSQSATLKPPKILLPADSQPNIKYFITSDKTFEVVKTDIVNGDINLMKLTSKANPGDRGLTDNNAFISGNIKKVIKITPSNINGNEITLTDVSGIEANDLLYLEILTPVSTGLDSGLIISPTAHACYKIVAIVDNKITLNRNPPKMLGVTFSSGVIIDGKEVGSVNKWNEDSSILWNDGMLNYDLNQGTISNTKPWSLSVVTLEQLAGYIDYKITLGYKYMGTIENYLGYNDSLNYEQEEVAEEGCSEKLINGFVDPFKKLVGIIHFENGHHSNVYGDSLLINSTTKFKIKLPSVLHYTTNEGTIGLTLASGTLSKKIPDSEIVYYDLYVDGTDSVVGKVLPNLKIAIIDDEEIVTALSIGSGRNFTLPPLSGKLITDGTGFLPSGKQIYVTYTLRSKTINTFYADSIHCNKYLLIKNTTSSAKNIELKFNDVKEFVHMVNPNVNTEIGYTSDNFEIVFQITDIDERPNPNNWSCVNFTSGLTFKSTPLNKDVLNPIALTTKTFLLKDSITQIPYTTTSLHGNQGGYIGDDTVLIGAVSTWISSITYKSLIQIRINSNQFIYTTNPTKFNMSQPTIVSEIGIYDSEDELVMIAKLSDPISLSTKSSILLELSMDF